LNEALSLSHGVGCFRVRGGSGPHYSENFSNTRIRFFLLPKDELVELDSDAKLLGRVGKKDDILFGTPIGVKTLQ